jgi:hypothetical protein
VQPGLIHVRVDELKQLVGAAVKAGQPRDGSRRVGHVHNFQLGGHVRCGRRANRDEGLGQAEAILQKEKFLLIRILIMT